MEQSEKRKTFGTYGLSEHQLLTKMETKISLPPNYRYLSNIIDLVTFLHRDWS